MYPALSAADSVMTILGMTRRADRSEASGTFYSLRTVGDAVDLFAVRRRAVMQLAWMLCNICDEYGLQKFEERSWRQKSLDGGYRYRRAAFRIVAHASQREFCGPSGAENEVLEA